MKQRFIALLLAVCIACTMLVMPASASSANSAVQAAVMLGGLTSEQAAGPDAVLTRGQLAKLLAAFSPYRESAGAQGSAGTLFTDVGGDDPLAPAIRIAVSQGWMSGYTDGSFRPGNPVILEEACAAALNLLGYDVTTLSGTFPTAQLNKARELGLRDGIARSQGEGLTIADGALLLYNALTVPTANGEVYGSTLGFTVTGGQVDTASILLGNVQGPFVAEAGAQLPFAPAAVYRNGEAAASAELNEYDVYYYSENARTVWIYTRKAAGRITAVAPSASAPTSVTVAGTEYTIGSSQAATVLSSLNGGGVGQVVTLLLGMNNEVVRVLTGEAADQVFYGVVQNSARSLIEDDGADVRQSVTVACTDGVTRTVNVDKSLNFPAGLLVEITVTGDGEQVARVDARSVSGTFNENGTALGGTPLADGVEIIDTTAEGVAGAIRPSRLSGVTLQSGDVRYYTTNAAGEIDRLILDNVTGDLWTYGVLDDVRNLTSAAADVIDEQIGRPSGDVTLPGGTTTGSGNAAADVANIILPSTSDILYGIIDGSIASTLWDSLTSSTGSVASYVLRLAADNTTGAMSNILGWLGKGASYVCYINGESATLNTAVKYPVLAGGVAVSRSPSGTVKNMIQLMPVMIDKVGAASVMSGSTRYETADNMQVYLWYRGQYYPTTLAQVNPAEYHLIGWYDNLGCTAGNKIRVLVAVKKD
ncbi:MAG TPA: S-layer homology domain-containing protein [Candidatus Faecalibacterium gallistercoris]|uniref:S-layer homology domain-containing protein n=1 Tax=Candidatus Faecalibacterium gallistercoris TaxID=2838579 RepID=A0A9D2JMI4_9FIRM|nr:S-layer homology domain-containing protein [Candidatus Faecalibacterium gallistercoris]